MCDLTPTLGLGVTRAICNDFETESSGYGHCSLFLECDVRHRMAAFGVGWRISCESSAETLVLVFWFSPVVEPIHIPAGMLAGASVQARAGARVQALVSIRAAL